jgi:Fe-S-cluster-containing dehydrogenase component
MAKRLFIDLTKCDECEKCEIRCAYFYRPQMTDHGVLALREMAAFAVICRRCENPDCVAACKFEALERQSDGLIKRYNMRCVSCKSCSHACPFGTIYPETLPFYVSKCDFCAMTGDEAIPCVIACKNKAIEFREVEESPKEGIFLVGEHLAVRAPRWDKKEV